MSEENKQVYPKKYPQNVLFLVDTFLTFSFVPIFVLHFDISLENGFSSNIMRLLFLPLNSPNLRYGSNKIY